MGVKRKEGQRVQEVSSLLVIKGLLIGWDSNGSPPSPEPQHLSIPLPCPTIPSTGPERASQLWDLGGHRRKAVTLADLGYILPLPSTSTPSSSLLPSPPPPTGNFGRGICWNFQQEILEEGQRNSFMGLWMRTSTLLLLFSLTHLSFLLRYSMKLTV